MEPDPKDIEIRELKDALRQSQRIAYNLHNVKEHLKHSQMLLEQHGKKQAKAQEKERKTLRKLLAKLTKSGSDLLLGKAWKRGHLFSGKVAKDGSGGHPGFDEALRIAREQLATDPPPIPQLPELPADDYLVDHLKPTVDVVVCVHNALDDVKVCLSSVAKESPRMNQLVIVDDGSEQATKEWLEAFAENASFPVNLIRNPQGSGYTKAANQGLRAAPGDYVVLLNSDTIVPPLWLEGIIACGESDEKIGIIGPLSNAASWQSVPERFSPEGDWMINDLPEGKSLVDFGLQLAARITPNYPRVPLVNGFCFAIKRSCINAVGEFDEASFPRGYGEENDFCLRAGKAGFDLAIVDNVYVFHAKSKSYSHEKRRELAGKANGILQEKHGENAIAKACEVLKDEPRLEELRKAVADLPELPSKKVFFVFDFLGNGGGTHSIVQEAIAMNKLGAFAQIAVPNLYLAKYLEAYPQAPPHLFYSYITPRQLIGHAKHFEVVAATLFSSVKLLKRIQEVHPHLLPAYYIQDYEPFFFAEGEARRTEAEASYTLIPDAVLFAKTKWLQQTVQQAHDLTPALVTPSIDHGVYFPPKDQDAIDRQQQPLSIAAMIRPQTPRRSPELTAEVLSQLKDEGDDPIELRIFGADAEDNFWSDFPQLRDSNAGILSREGVADILRSSTIFIDLSTYQAFGRTSLEAMACGCIPVIPAAGGGDTYGVHEDNCLVVDTSDKEAILETLRRLLQNRNLRQDLRSSALETASRFTPEKAAQSELDLFAHHLHASS